MRLTHPPPQPLPPFHPRFIPLLLHPSLEIFGADPAGIYSGEEGKKGAHFALLCGGGLGGVGRGDTMQERPSVVSESVNIWGTVWGEGRCGGEGGERGGGGAGGGG